MASLDAARRQLAVHGEALLHEHAARRRARCARRSTPCPGCRVVGEELVGRPGVAAWDPLRIVIDVRGTGRTGYEVAAALRATYDIQVELATHATIVLVLGVAQPPRTLERFAHDLAETIGRDRAPGRRARRSRAPPAALRERGGGVAARRVPRARRRSSRSTTRSAASRARRSPATRRASRRCCPASGSPPRSSPTCASCVAAGARLHGASDPAFQTDRRALRPDPRMRYDDLLAPGRRGADGGPRRRAT